jgi:hypothetical protein
MVSVQPTRRANAERTAVTSRITVVVAQIPLAFALGSCSRCLARREADEGVRG